MKRRNLKYISLILVALLVMNTSAIKAQKKENVWQWITSLGSPNWDYVNGIQTDSDGNIYIGGAYSGKFFANKKDYDTQGKQDIFVAKYNHKGKLKWLWNAGGKQSDKLTAIYATKNNELIISGIVSGKIEIGKQTIEGDNKKLILAKLSKKGKLEWIKSFPIENPSSMYHIYESETTGIIVAGTFKKTFTMGDQKVESQGKEDIFIAKFNALGELQKLNTYGGKGKDAITSFIGSENGKIYISVSYQGAITIGEHNLASPGKKVTGAFITSFNQDLESEWLHSFESQSYVHISAIAPALNNTIYITGNFTNKVKYLNQELTSNGAMDFYTANLDSIGNPIWMKSYGTSYTDYANNIVLNPAGGIMLNGTFNDTLLLDTIQLVAVEGNATAFVSQINEKGNIFWAESIGGKSSVTSHHSMLDKQGNIFISGSYTGNIESSEFNIESKGKEDIYLAKYFNCPEYQDVIQGDYYVCSGGELELKVKGKFDNINWNNGLFNEKKITVTEAGVYFVEMTDKNACLVQDTIEIIEAPGIEFSLGADTLLFTDQSITLYGPENMADYWWYNDYNVSSQEISSQGNSNQRIDVWLEITDSLACQFTDSIVVSFEQRSPMIKINSSHGLSIYPNPVSDNINWLLNSQQKVSLYVDLTNIQGQLMYQKLIYNYMPGQEESIPVQNLPAGNYYLNVGNKFEKISKTVIIVNE